MINKIVSKPSNWNFYLLCLVNVLLLLLPNVFFLQDKYASCETLQVFIGLLLSLIASFIFLSATTSLSRILFILFNCICYLLSSVASYFQFFYKILITPTLIQSIINTDIKESTELINLSLILWVTLIGILPCILLVYSTYKLRNTNFNFRKIIKIVLIGLGILLLSIMLIGRNMVSLRVISNSLPSFLPYSYILTTKNYYAIYRSSLGHKIVNINQLSSSTIEENTNHDLNIVLIIGESARSDRWQINGYERKTNPRLYGMKNLISFKNAYSLATNTPDGIYAIMKNTNYYDCSSFISIFNQLNFDTYWLSNQGTKYEMINSIAKEAKKSLFSDDIRTTKLGNNYDGDLLPFIKEALDNKHHKLIVIHTIGSHRLYDLRYPSEFKQFEPVCINNEAYYSAGECTDIVKLDNSYDNTILYTDYFISEVIRSLSNSKALLIYISDHGESLGENGIFAHAYPMHEAPKEQKHIPLIIWASDRWLEDQKAGQKFEHIKTKTDDIVDQSSIFHTILDCAGVKSDLIDKSKSLCH